MSQTAVREGGSISRRDDIRRLLPVRVEVHRDPADVLAVWAELEAVAPASAYQTRAWLLPWLDTVGRKLGIEPLFLVFRHADGCACGLICLGVERRGPFRVAVFLGAKLANFNLGLFRPHHGVTRQRLQTLLREAARIAGPGGPDLYVLLNQPPDWEGFENPLAAFAPQAAPSKAHMTALQLDAAAFLETKLSKEARRKLRKKENKLAEQGRIEHVVAADRAAAATILDAFFAQKVARFRDPHIHAVFDDPALRAFFEAAAPATIELHALRIGEKIVATYGGTTHRGRFSGMFNSFDLDPGVARSSPADLLLMKLVASKCAAGLDSFDLGVGEARYKSVFCDQPVALVDAFLPVNLRGVLLAQVIAATLRLKRSIKQNPRLFALARRMRTFIR